MLASQKPVDGEISSSCACISGYTGGNYRSATKREPPLQFHEEHLEKHQALRLLFVLKTFKILN